MSKTKRALIISHGHPSFSLGGGEVASYNLHNGLHDLPGWESHYLARVAPPIAPGRAASPLPLTAPPPSLAMRTAAA